MEGIIFDLDGVICFTDDYHYLAWKALADRLDIAFDRTVNNRLRGVSRMGSLEIILEAYHGKTLSDAEKQNLAAEKNEIYRKYLEKMTPADLAEETKKPLTSFAQGEKSLQSVRQAKTHRLFLRESGLAAISTQ